MQRDHGNIEFAGAELVGGCGPRIDHHNLVPQLARGLGNGRATAQRNRALVRAATANHCDLHVSTSMPVHPFSATFTYAPR